MEEVKMDGPMIRIWIHAYFSTKDLMPLINDSFEGILYSKIKDKLVEEYNSYVRAIKGTENHIHILFMVNPNYRFVDIMKNIKGESSHWVNQNRLLDAKFSWQKSYDAFSVDESSVELVAAFIENQKEYHKNITFPEERELFLKKYGNKITETGKKTV